VKKTRKPNDNDGALELDPYNDKPADIAQANNDIEQVVGISFTQPWHDDTYAILETDSPMLLVPGPRSVDSIADKIVYTIKAYVEGALCDYTWIVDPLTRAIRSKGGASSHEHMNDWDSHMLEAIYFINNNQTVQGFDLLNLCLDKAPQIFLEQDVELVSNLTWYIPQLLSKKHEVLVQLLCFFHQLSATVLGSSHPVSVFWECCRRVIGIKPGAGRDACHYVQLAMETMVRALEVGTDGLTQASFSINRRTIKFSNRAQLISSPDYQMRLNALIQRGNLASRSSSHNQEVLDEALIRAGIDLFQSHQESLNLDEAKQQCRTLAGLLEKKGPVPDKYGNSSFQGDNHVHADDSSDEESTSIDDKIYTRLTYEYLYALVRQYDLEEDYRAAETVSRRLVEFCEDQYGLSDSTTVCAMEKRANILRKMGRWEEAREVLAIRQGRIPGFRIRW